VRGAWGGAGGQAASGGLAKQAVAAVALRAARAVYISHLSPTRLASAAPQAPPTTTPYYNNNTTSTSHTITAAAAAALAAPSHTSISLPLGAVDLFGNYSVTGPAILRKLNNVLVALVQPGGGVSMLTSSSAAPTLLSVASLSHDDEGALVTLSGHHLELAGGFEMTGAAAARGHIQHGGKTIVSPDRLSEDDCITLLPGGTVSHPICCTRRST
jgi:hypothetical protein